MTKHIVRVAIHDETNEGWVWTRGHGSRSVVKITNLANCRSVYCQVRMIDDNFEKKYNERDSGRISLTAGETIVISEWYRDALGGFGPTGKDNVTGLVDLRIEPLYWPLRWWGYLRVAAHHPEIVVRIGLTLGVLGAGLGLVALIPPLLKIFEICELYQSYIVLGAALVAIIVGLWSCRRPPPIS